MRGRMVGNLRERRARTGVVAASIALAALFAIGPSIAGNASASISGSSHSQIIVTLPTVSGARVLWNGQNISSASSAGSAVSISKGQTVPVLFRFGEPEAGLVRSASLQLTYLGVVLTTSKAGAVTTTEAPFQGEAQINWSFDPLYDALEGVFEFKASLLNASGGSLWSQTFYVFAKAPYLLESAAVVVLLVLAVAELYWVASAIREARKGARPPPPTAWVPPSQGTSGAPTTTAPTGEGTAPGGSAGAPPPAGPGAPGSGGTP